MLLRHKNIILGISGGIAAYKTPDLVRRLRDEGAEVRVVMTQGASSFVTPLSLEAVSGYSVTSEILDRQTESAMSHIDLARWADVCLIAPATAQIIAKIAHGFADDLLTTLLLATKAPVVICPAMNMHMYQHPAVQHNVAQLQARGCTLVGPAEGVQACGDVGPGRMVEPLDIIQALSQQFEPLILQGKNVLITAGPTQEALDPVRYVSNHSSGKMGFALAEHAARLGATVYLVTGRVHLPTPSGVKRIDVVSAQDMLSAVMDYVDQADLFIGCAAVADYRAADVQPEKIKKSASTLHLELVKNPDIIQTVAALPRKPFTVGFAAETTQCETYAKDKLVSKKLDMIALNNVSQPEQVFGHDDNALDVFWHDGSQSLPRTSKSALALQLLRLISQRCLQ